MSCRHTRRVVLLAVTALAACGGGGGSGSGGAATAPITSAPPPTIAPLAPGAVPFVLQGPLPVPTRRHVDGTRALVLDGAWRFRADPWSNGEHDGWFDPRLDRAAWRTIDVPGVWTEAFADLADYEGIGWFATTFDLPPGDAGEPMLLRIGAAFLRSRVWLNGALLGESSNGYAPIHLPTGGALRPTGNVLVVKVDNRLGRDTIPADVMTSPGKHGWWPHGGIHRSVTLHRLPDPWLFKVEPRFVPGTDRVEVTLGLVARAAHPGRALRWSIAGPGGGAWTGSVLLEVPGPGVHVHRFEVPVEPPRTWSRERPDHLYALDLACDGGDALTVRFGARTFEVRGTELLLNGRRDHWKGINRHSDAPGRGPVETPASIAEDLALLRALHVNHTRPGHYPVDERLLDALGDAGVTVLEEVPVYQLFLGQVTDRALIAEAAAQLGAMIERDKNDPQILSWSIGNEFGNYLPGADALTRALADEARRLDPSRPVTAVINNVSAIVRVDFALGPVDIIGLNQYYGWYLGDVTDAGRALDIVHGLHPTKPIFASEFGADALAGRRLTGPPGPEPNDDHSYAEEWQAWYLEQQLAQLRARPYLSGTMPWVLADFRYEWSPSTGKPHPVAGMNLKGLVTRDRRTRKAAFDVLERAYR